MTVKLSLSRNTPVLVTGGFGFLGRHIVDELATRGVIPMVVHKSAFDLRREVDADRLIDAMRPELVIHAAWTGGGIGFAQQHPYELARDNAIMAIHVHDACQRYQVRKLVGIGSVCEYPKVTPVPFREDDLWNGYPEETNGPYGVAKRMMLALSQAYRKEHGLSAIHLLMVNLYGPHDNFDLESGHVIPSMIRKFVEAKERGDSFVTMWGDGSPTREFIHVMDAARAIVRAAEIYDHPDPVNIGTGTEISIRELATMIAARVGYDGDVHWNRERPNGQPRRMLDVSRAEERFGFRAGIQFDIGLMDTVDWYLREGRSAS